MGNNYLNKVGTLWLFHIEYIMDHYMTHVMFLAGGIITLEDLQQYQVAIKPAVEAKLLNKTLTAYGPPPPSSAIVVAFILNIIEGK